MSSARRQRRNFNRRAKSEGVSLHHALKKVDAYYGEYKDKSKIFLEDVLDNGTKYQREAAKMLLETIEK